MPPIVQTLPLAVSGATRRPIAHGVRAHLDDAAEALAEVDDEPGAKRLAADAGAGAAGDERDVVLMGVADERLQVLLVARPDHAGRRHLEDAGVGAVEGARQVVKKQLALEEALQVVADPAS
jgi:hypothetical protein